jgi:hypothetical protein
MTKYLTLLFVCLLAVSCMDDKISRPMASGSSKDSTGVDFKAVAHLPVHIDSTKYLLHPIGELSDESSGYYSSNASSGGSVYSSSDEIHGQLSNIKFQQLDSEEMVALTSVRVRIYSVQFLRGIFENTGKQFLLYELLDKDSNDDDKLNGEDVRSLYLSGINGENFRKLTPEGQHFTAHNTVDEMNRVYFKSMEDSNEDGRVENNEPAHLFYIDLAAEAPKVVEYYPLKAK